MHCLFLLLLYIPPLVFSETDSWWREDLRNNINPWIESEKIQKPYTNDPTPCVCVKPFECSESGMIKTDGLGIVGFRSGSKCRDGLVCCIPPLSDSSSSEEEHIPKPGEIIVLGEIESSPGGGKVSGVNPPVTETTVQAIEELYACGEGAYEPEIIFKVSGDDDETQTYLGDFPWMLLMNYEDVTLQRIGGASLIHPQVALTAAHNVIGKEWKKIIIRGAEYDLKSEEESFTQDVRVKKVILHPDYQKKPPKNDIAVLILEKPFQITATVRTICLPPKDSHPVWKTCFATGWGSRGKDKAPSSQVLRKAEMSLVPRNVCQAIFIKNGFRPNFKVHESFLCAGSSSTADTCQGDGGGPLQCHTSDSRYFHLVGITAWGLECGQKGIPGAYTDVSYFIDFIENTLIDEKIYVNEISKSFENK